MKRVKVFFINAILLFGTSILMRTIGVGFNIFVSNKIGASGMGLFQLVMSVYSFAVTFATSGINLGTSRLIAEALGKNSDAEIKSAMKRCMTYSLCFGICGSVILFIFSNFIGETLLGDIRTVTSLKFLAVSLPFIAISSSMHGYFTAVRRVYKNASAIIFEQFVKITLTSIGFIFIAPKGLEYACLSVVAGSSIAEVFSFIFSFIMYRYDIYKHNKNTGEIEKNLTKKLLNISIPVALSAYVRSALLTVEQLLIPKGFKKFGASGEQALATYGVIQGMVFPIVLFPQAFLSSFSGLLIPELAESKAAGNDARINYIIKRVFQITLCFSVGAAGIMMCYSYELGNVLYNNSEAALYIRYFAPLIPIMYLDSAVDGMLKGLNQQLYSMRVNIIDAFVSVVMVWFLIPVIGVKGYIITVFACELLNAALSISRLISIADFKIDILKWILKPLFCVIGATSCVNLLFSYSGIMFKYDSVNLAIHIFISALCYLLFLRITYGVDKDDIKWIKSIVKG